MIPNKADVLDTIRLYLEPLAAKADVNERMRIYRLFNQVEDLFCEIANLEYNNTILENMSTELEQIVRQVHWSPLIRYKGDVYHLVPTDGKDMTDNDIAIFNADVCDISWEAQL